MNEQNQDIFASVRDKANSGLENQQMSFSLLSAVEATIKEKHLDLVPAAYYASLMTLLQQQLEDARKNHKQLISIAHLLSLLFPTLSQHLLRTHFEEISNTLAELITVTSENPSAAMERYLMLCVSRLLASQDGSAWATSPVNSLFQSMLIYAMDDRPKVRKAAELAIHFVLSHPPAPMIYHPSTSSILRFVQHGLKQKDQKNLVSHVLNVLMNCWSYLKPSVGQQLSDILLTFITSPKESISPTIVQKALECLEAYSKAKSKQGNWDKEGIVNFVNKLLSYHPNVNDTSSLSSWLASIQIVHKYLVVQELSTEGIIAKAFVSVFKLLQLTPNTAETTVTAHASIESVLNFLISTLDASTILKFTCDSSDIQSIMAIVSKGLSLNYQSGWSVVFKVLNTLTLKLASFRSEIPEAPILLNNIFTSLSDDSVYAQNSHFLHLDAFFELVGSGIIAFGPRKFLEIMPLDLENTFSSRAWLLSILKGNVVNGELKHYLDYFVPLSVTIAHLGHKYLQEGQTTESKNAAVIWRQIWDMLPGFCAAPVDIQECFKPLCSLVIPILNSNDDRCVPILDGLRALVLRSQQNFRGKLMNSCVSAEKSLKDLEYLSPFASEIFPVLLTKYVNTFKSSTPELKTMILETIRSWVSISASVTVNKFFETALRRYLELSKSQQESELLMAQKHALLDLANVMIPSAKLSVQALEVFSRIALMGIESSDATIQKKCYKSLTHMCGLIESAPEENIIENSISLTQEIKDKLWMNATFLNGVCEKLVDTAMITDSAAKKDRLALLNKILCFIDWNHDKQLQLIPGVLSEVILGTKEANEKSRAYSYETLVKMCTKVNDISKESNGQAMIKIQDEGEVISYSVDLDEFCKMVLAGLAGKTPHMVSSTIHVLARLLYEFRSKQMEVNSDVTDAVIQAVLIVAEDTRNREIIKSILGFLKVVIITHPNLILCAEDDQNIEMDNNESDVKFNYLKTLITVLTKWSSEHKSHFRVTCRHVLERVLRKVNYSIVEKYFPEDQKKLLRNIKKRKDRSQKKKKQQGEDKPSQSFEQIIEDESGGEDDEDDDLPQILQELVRVKSKGKGSAVVLKENAEVPLNFLDKKMAAASIQSKSSKRDQPRKRKATEFKEENGKLVINESEGENQEEEIMKGKFEEVQKAYMDSVTSKDGFHRSADGKRIKFNNNNNSNKKKRRNN